MQDGFQTANTALIYHANKLLVLHEGDLPYAVCHASLISCMQAFATCCSTLHLQPRLLALAALYDGICPSGMTRLIIAGRLYVVGHL